MPAFAFASDESVLPVCLDCGENLANNKRSNVPRHFQNKHSLNWKISGGRWEIKTVAEGCSESRMEWYWEPSSIGHTSILHVWNMQCHCGHLHKHEETCIWSPVSLQMHKCVSSYSLPWTMLKTRTAHASQTTALRKNESDFHQPWSADAGHRGLEAEAPLSRWNKYSCRFSILQKFIFIVQWNSVLLPTYFFKFRSKLRCMFWKAIDDDSSRHSVCIDAHVCSSNEHVASGSSHILALRDCKKNNSGRAWIVSVVQLCPYKKCPHSQL